MFDALLDALSRSAPAASVYNPYAYGNPYNDLRRANLRQYLQEMAARAPSALLVMEAPGYRGCRLTGVPVTSRRLLLEGVPSLGVLGGARGYQDVPEPDFAHIQGEQSATIVWGTLAQLGIVPLIWNAFPFHPHRPQQPLTNRAPRKDEVALGRSFLQALLRLYQPAKVIAVGRIAESALGALGVAHHAVRHPSQGGKNDFIKGLQTWLSVGD